MTTTEEAKMTPPALAEAPAPRQLSLPKFEGLTIPTARLSFGGGLELTLTSEEDVALVKAIGLGKQMTVTIAVDGHERELVLGAECTARTFKSRKMEQSEGYVGVHRITIADVRDTENDDPDDGE